MKSASDKSPSPSRARGWVDVLRWLTTRRPVDWPKNVPIVPQKIPVERVFGAELRVTFINHATVLIQTEGLNFLTDPIWSRRAGPMGMIGPKRVRAPGVRLEDLPKIDYVLISHNHYDHMDLPTIKKLQKAHDPQFFVGRGNSRWLHRQGVRRVTDLNWWQEVQLTPDVKVTFVPAQHYARRGLLDHNKTLWGGFVIKGSCGAIYFAGDTGLGGHFEEIGAYCGEVRVALLPIGAYSPRWFMAPVHMSPDDAVKVHQLLQAVTSIGIHFGTFHLSDEGFDDPAKELKSALRRHKVSPDAFKILEPGEGFDVPESIP